MDFDKKTIELYLKESIAKISILKADIATYEYKIKQSHREIDIMNYLIDQYEKALEMLKEKQNPVVGYPYNVSGSSLHVELAGESNE